MMRQGPTASVLLSTDLGEMKIPEPMMVPTMMQMPLSRPTSDVEEGRRVNAAPASGSPAPPSHPPSLPWVWPVQPQAKPFTSRTFSCHVLLQE